VTAPLGGVLVGGQSRRFGSDKATAHVGSRSMSAWAVRTLREVSDPVVLLGGDGRLARRMALPWRADERSGCGPLAGVAAGLRWAVELARPGLLVLACDLPLVTSSLMKTIYEAADPEADAVVPHWDTGEVQPLCAWYGPAALPIMESSLERGEFSMRSLLLRLRVRTLDEEESPEPVRPLLLNVNTPEALTLAEQWRSERG
jgi:molybdopterin-guanine dinucleotide biosynthesis protein A